MQQQLLPGTVPAVTGFEVAARYQPAGDGPLVGGDWYDVVLGPAGRRRSSVTSPGTASKPPG